MKTMTRAAAALLSTVAIVSLHAQQSGREYRRTGVHNANQVRTVFGNWGVIGQPGSAGPRGAWRDDNNGYLGDVSPIVGAEINWQGTIFHSVVSVPVDRPGTADQSPTGKRWTFEPVEGYFNASQERVAMSTDPASWPPVWPDRLSDAVDPGWPGSWNGYFGKRISADQESYFVMDDNNDERFNFAGNNALGISFKPDSLNPSRNGMALEVKVRGMQWAQFLAKDNIFWLYEITNKGTTNYNKVVFGMLVGTYVGVTGNDNSPQEYDDDWSFYDVSNDITYSGDFPRNNARNPLWNGPVGMVGYAFLESPGNPFDGIDNDGDSDSSAFTGGATKFGSASFDTLLISAGDQLVLIGQDFSRTLFTVPAVDSVLVTTRGLTRWIYPGTTRVAEGNVLRDVTQNTFINPNAYDGVDNDYDGLIDENSFVHYRQVKRTNTVPPKTLIDVLRPLRFINYKTGAGTNPLSMIDEKRTDNIDNDQDWVLAFDDVGRDGIDGTGDFGEGDGVPTSGVDAFGFDTGLPGEPNIDKTDVSESDQIGLTSFYYFTPAGNVRFDQDETLWRSLAPGFFDVPSTIVENRPEAGEDGDFFYGSGYFPLLAGETERFSLALVYGGGQGGGVTADIADLLKNKQTVQKIYDSNYQFPQPPDKPTLTVVPGDKQVTLYWDRKAEYTIDPVLKINDFEGYKIYRSTDPNFSDIFDVTDATGAPQTYRALAQFDLRNSVSGFFRAQNELFQGAAGLSYYLGNNSGLLHSYVDRGLDNGRTYYYAIVAYDRGDELVGIFPSENTKIIRVRPTGEVDKDINTAVVVPNGKAAGYVRPADAVALTETTTKVGTGNVLYRIIDETKLTGHPYTVTFTSTESDGLDNNGNGLIDAADSSEYTRLTSGYSVYDEEAVTETIIAQDTTIVRLQNEHIDLSTFSLVDASGSPVAAGSYVLNTSRGEIRGSAVGDLPRGNRYTATYKYYPVYRSPYIKNSPFEAEDQDADIFDGLQLVFENDWNIVTVDSLSGWTNQIAYIYNFVPLLIEDPFSGMTFKGYTRPADYRIEFSTAIVDTSYSDPNLYPFSTPVNFRVYNITEGRYVKFIFVDNNFDGKLGPIEELVLLEENPDGNLGYTWDIFFINKPSDPAGTIYTFTAADTLIIRTTKPFRGDDVFTLRTTTPEVDRSLATQQLSKVRVVPNPYIAASSLEPPLPPNVTVGRIRRIDFTRLPANCKVHIYTARGDHVVTLRHDGNIEDGTVSWNMKSKENLDVAFGVYFYVVESEAGNQTGKLAIIK